MTTLPLAITQNCNDTNALLVSGGELCAIFNLRAYQNEANSLFITKASGLDCKEGVVKDYTL